MFRHGRPIGFGLELASPFLARSALIRKGLRLACRFLEM
jgi:hypothetical protein